MRFPNNLSLLNFIPKSITRISLLYSRTVQFLPISSNPPRENSFSLLFEIITLNFKCELLIYLYLNVIIIIALYF